MENPPTNEPEVNPVAQPEPVSKPPASPRSQPKKTLKLPVPEPVSQPPASPRSHSKKQLNLPIPEELLILTIDDSAGAVSAQVKSMLRYLLAGALLASLVQAKKIQLEEDRLTISSSKPSGDALFDDILAMITAEKKPRKLSHWIQAIGSKLTIKQMVLRLVERKVIAIEKKQFAWVIPYPAFPQGQASAKYLVKQLLRGIVLAGEPAACCDWCSPGMSASLPIK